MPSKQTGHTPAKPAGSPKKRIAITLDDGPNEPYTSEILDFLDTVGVKVTLFQVGKCIERFPEVTKRAYQSGHVIASHSYSHALTKYILQPRMLKEIEATQQAIRDITGKTPLLFRAPWFLHTPMLRSTVARKSLTLVGGSLPHSTEALQPNAQSLANHALKRAKDGAILIFHDGYRARTGYRGQTAEAIKITVTTLLQHGYDLVTVDKLLDVEAYAK